MHAVRNIRELQDEMKKNILLVIVVGAYLATLGNLVWETWDYGPPSDLPKPNPGSDSDKEIGDHL